MTRKFAYVAFVLLVISSSLLLAQKSSSDAMREYQQKVAKANATTADAHYELAKWAYDNDLFAQARKEIDAALALQKDHVPSLLLLRRLEETLATRPVTTEPASKPTTGTAANISDLDKLLVSNDDIYHIRIQELRKDDVVAIEFKNNVIERFLKVMRGRQEFEAPQAADNFKALPPVARACRIREEFPEDYSWLNDIVVKSDPKFMVDFRGKVWPIIAQQCATSECHGGSRFNGGYRLFNPAFKNERLDYTNFVILDGVLTRGSRRLIDRDRSDDSLILQFGLPDEQARVHHPRPIKYAFPSRDAGTYATIKDWVDMLKSPPHPNYELKYQMPAPAKSDADR